MRLALLIALVTLTSCASAQRPPELSPAHRAALDGIVAEEMAATHLPGAAVVIVRDGRTVFARGYGVADVAAGTPVDPDRTLFRIGSVTKALTALAVTRLIDDGRLDADADVSAFVEGITNPGGVGGAVTVDHLLTHTGGFDQVGGADRQVYRHELSLDARKALRPALADYLAGGTLRRTTAPGRLFRYDTFGISLAGLVAERVTGLPYAQAMRQELFEPLGMDRSFVEADDAHLGDLALGYGWVDGAFVAQPYEVYATTPASSIDATPADMGRLLEALTGGGANAHGRLVSPATAAAVLAPQFRPHPRIPGVTHGLWEFPASTRGGIPRLRSVGHGGSMNGYWALLVVLPDARTGVFIVANRHPQAGGGEVTLGNRILDWVATDLLDVPPAPEPLAPAPDSEVDLDAYAGSYFYNVYCQTCTPDEFARGGWRRPTATRVVRDGDALRILNGARDERHLPTAEPDVFVEAGGAHEVFFGRADDGRVGFFVYSTSPDTFERASAPEQARLDAADDAATALQLRLDAAEGLDDDARTEAVAEALRAALDAGLHTEASLNALGYAYVGAERLPLATAVFRFNAAAFPASWNVHDSLGEALAAAGRRDEAIEAYRRSVDLNPESESGLAALEQLSGR